MAPLYSLWMAMPCAVPAGIERPQSPSSAARSSTRLTVSLLRYLRRNATGSCFSFLASWSTISSLAVATSGE